jgi:hypothetical protein
MRRKLFRPRREEEAEGRTLHNEAHRNLYDSLNIMRMIKIKEDKVGGACSTHGGDEKCMQYF